MNLLDELYFIRLKKLLSDMAEGVSSKTEIFAVPPGTLTWRAEKIYHGNPPRLESAYIDLVPFFGSFLGYSKELDIIAFSER